MQGIAVHSFAGGIVMGVRNHFDVVRAYEPLGFGVETLEERLGLTAWAVGEHDVTKWRLPRGEVDFVFGNPRCGGFSALGSNAAVAGISMGADCRQSLDAEQLCRFGVRCRAGVIAFESVQGIMAPSNRGFVKRMALHILLPNGYRVAHVFHNAMAHGSCQSRRRYYMVAYRQGLTFNAIVDHPPIARAPTVGDVLSRFDPSRRIKAARLFTNRSIDYDADTRYLLNEDVERLIPHLEPGDCTNNLHFRYGPAFFRALGSERLWRTSDNARSNCPFGTAGRSNCPLRLKWDGGCPTLCGDCHTLIHPKEDRTLTVGELAALMGWPDGIIPAGPQPAAQIAKGVVPSTGEWIARCARDCLLGEWGEDVEVTWDARRNDTVEHDATGMAEKVINLTAMVPKKQVTMLNNATKEEREPLPALIRPKMKVRIRRW